MTFTPLAPTPIFPSIHFVQQFLPLPFIKDDPSTLLCEAPPDDDDFVCPPLSPDSYHTHFRPLLQDELSTTALVKSEIVLWQTRVFCAESSSYANQHEESTEFALFVPGIRENHPKVDVCDLVHLREIFGQLASGLGFEGRVTRLRKREGIIRKSITCSRDDANYGLLQNLERLILTNTYNNEATNRLDQTEQSL